MTLRHAGEGGFLLLLTAILLAATSPFFGAFWSAAVIAGASMSIGLRWWHDRRPDTTVPPPLTDRQPQLNISAIHVAGDVIGLIAVAGAVAVFLLSMTSLRAFLGVSVLCACLVAAARVAWRRNHAAWSTGASVVNSR